MIALRSFMRVLAKSPKRYKFPVVMFGLSP